MRTFRIHIKGRVQGVGFRPFVYRIAHECGVKGWVNNTSDGLHIEVSGDEEDLNSFCYIIFNYPPRLAQLQSISKKEIPFNKFSDFHIVESKTDGATDILVTPDFAICEDCLKELTDPDNRRYNYPFITCTNCGPRYSITHTIPYDRPSTTMADFNMCSSCDREYNDPMNRRYYSQTNSCPDCAVELQLFDNNIEQLHLSQEKIIEAVVEAIKKGKIVAVKGIGGYLLMADAANSSTIKLLRERKHRPAKPFAVMYPSIDAMKTELQISEKMENLFLSPASPIVIAPLRNKKTSIAAAEIAPGNPFIGAMIPYTPLFQLIMKEINKPLIATSGNISGSPIIYNDQEAIHLLSKYADLIVANNREILVPQDDSVVKFSVEIPIILRRSRGYAPSFIHQGFDDEKPVLAVGGEMKNTFAFQHKGQTYISQYLGDVGSYDTQKSYRTTLDHLMLLLKFKPEVILHDAHPTYFTTQLAQELAEKWQVPLISIQHHQAHFAAVLAENNLWKKQEKILGFCWDGMGYGRPDEIWGGEVFSFENGIINRSGHFEYYNHILNDRMAKEPRIAAIALAMQNEQLLQRLENKFSAEEWNFLIKMMHKPAQIKTSSAGRLFDGVASLLGLKDINTFEGEAAMALEFAAMKVKKGADSAMMPYPTLVNGSIISVTKILHHISKDLKDNVPVNDIAYRFHLSLAEAIHQVVQNERVQHVAFSGGVFQNALLVELIQKILKNYNFYFHQQLSPNDENISFGQLAYYFMGKQKKVNQKASINRSKSLTSLSKT